MVRNYSIYALTDPTTNQIFYVGRTGKHPMQRYEEHIKDFKGPSPKQIKLREMFDGYKGKPGLVILETDIKTLSVAFMREVFWMESLYSAGSPLTNASIDFNGQCVLTDYPNSQLVDKTTPSIDKYLSDIQEGNSIQFFRIEDLETFTPRVKGTNLSDYDWVSERSKNASAGQLLNAGLPVTEEEINILVALYQEDRGLEYLEEFFQRSRKSLAALLDARGIALTTEQQLSLR